MSLNYWRGLEVEPLLLCIESCFFFFLVTVLSSDQLLKKKRNLCCALRQLSTRLCCTAVSTPAMKSTLVILTLSLTLGNYHSSFLNLTLQGCFSQQGCLLRHYRLALQADECIQQTALPNRDIEMILLSILSSNTG